MRLSPYRRNLRNDIPVHNIQVLKPPDSYPSTAISSNFAWQRQSFISGQLVWLSTWPLQASHRRAMPSANRRPEPSLTSTKRVVVVGRVARDCQLLRTWKLVSDTYSVPQRRTPECCCVQTAQNRRYSMSQRNEPGGVGRKMHDATGAPSHQMCRLVDHFNGDIQSRISQLSFHAQMASESLSIAHEGHKVTFWRLQVVSY